MRAGTVAMSEGKATRLDDGRDRSSEESFVRNSELEQLLRPELSQVKAALESNPNASDGSVGNLERKKRAERFASMDLAEQEHSIELVDYQASGNEIVIASRQIAADENIISPTSLNDKATTAELLGHASLSSSFSEDVAYRLDGLEGAAPYLKRPAAEVMQSFKSEEEQTIKRAAEYSQKVAESNYEFLYQFFAGTGADFQPHTNLASDSVLQEFVHSPGANAIRRQYVTMGYPQFTDKLGYSTLNQAFRETVARPIVDAVYQALHSNRSLLDIATDKEHLGNIGVQVGGFGNPPVDDPRQWARATAARCDAKGTADANGNFVTFNVMNVAGRKSFLYHFPTVTDRELDEEGPVSGPMRSIVQQFRWIEPLPSKEKQ